MAAIPLCLKMRTGNKGIDLCVLFFRQKPYIVPSPLMHVRLSIFLHIKSHRKEEF